MRAALFAFVQRERSEQGVQSVSAKVRHARGPPLRSFVTPDQVLASPCGQVAVVVSQSMVKASVSKASGSRPCH